MKELNRSEKITELVHLNNIYEQSKSKTYNEQIEANDNLLQFVNDYGIVNETLEMWKELATWKLKYNNLLSKWGLMS